MTEKEIDNIVDDKEIDAIVDKLSKGDFSDLVPGERSFRRGFQHGYQRAIEDIQRKCSLLDIQNFCLDELATWRFFKVGTYSKDVPPSFVKPNVD